MFLALLRQNETFVPSPYKPPSSHLHWGPRVTEIECSDTRIQHSRSIYNSQRTQANFLALPLLCQRITGKNSNPSMADKGEPRPEVAKARAYLASNCSGNDGDFDTRRACGFRCCVAWAAPAAEASRGSYGRVCRRCWISLRGGVSA